MWALQEVERAAGELVGVKRCEIVLDPEPWLPHPENKNKNNTCFAYFREVLWGLTEMIMCKSVFKTWKHYVNTIGPFKSHFGSGTSEQVLSRINSAQRQVTKGLWPSAINSPGAL